MKITWEVSRGDVYTIEIDYETGIALVSALTIAMRGRWYDPPMVPVEVKSESL
jgi:hypothetical protein